MKHIGAIEGWIDGFERGVVGAKRRSTEGLGLGTVVPLPEGVCTPLRGGLEALPLKKLNLTQFNCVLDFWCIWQAENGKF